MLRLPLCAMLLCPLVLLAQASLPTFPQPERLLKSEKQFNAVHFGPGNTVTIDQAPPDLQLEAFDFSADEKLLYLEWGSGRLETRELESGEKVAELKPVNGPVWQVHQSQAGQLVIIAQHGDIRFVDSHSGKTLREIHAKKGKFNYDIQQILLARDGSWMAYVNEDNGRVLDLRTDPPKVLADLEDGYDMELSPDGAALWIIDREKIFGLDVNSWKPIGETNLLDQVSLDQTPTLAVLSDHGSPVAFVTSKSGLLRYELPSLKGQKISSIPTYWVAADREDNYVFVHEFKASTLYRADGTEACRWQIHPAQDFKISPSGQWLGDRLFGTVELWSTQSLIKACPVTPSVQVQPTPSS